MCEFTCCALLNQLLTNYIIPSLRQIYKMNSNKLVKCSYFLFLWADFYQFKKCIQECIMACIMNHYETGVDNQQS